MKKSRITLIGWYIILVLFIIFSLLSLTGCKTKTVVQTDTESHKMSEFAEKMDSIFRSTATWQQDMYMKQSLLIDSIREREKSNTSQSVVLNENGDTVKQVIIKERVIEKERSTDSKESETIIHLQSQIDSLIQISVENKALTDSLLKEHNKETVIEKQPTWWEKVKGTVGGYAIVLFIIFIGFKLITILRKRA